MVNTINICIFLQCSIAEANSGARIKARVARRNSSMVKKFGSTKMLAIWPILDIFLSSFFQRTPI